MNKSGLEAGLSTRYERIGSSLLWIMLSYRKNPSKLRSSRQESSLWLVLLVALIGSAHAGARTPENKALEILF